MTREHESKTVELDRKMIAKVMKKIDICMMTTVASDGQLHSRPMSNNKDVEWDGETWFFAPLDSSQTQEIQQNPNVNLAYSRPRSIEFVSATGRAQIVHDDAKKKELWSNMFRIWFPDGPEDDSVVLIKVDVQHVHYWSKKGEGELAL